MIELTNLTNAPNQETTVKLADGTVLTLDFFYNPATQRWTFSAARGTFIVNEQNLCVHPNILRALRNVASFGLACSSRDGGDPFSITDFSSGRIRVFVLDGTAGQTDIENVETTFYGGLV